MALRPFPALSYARKAKSATRPATTLSSTPADTLAMPAEPPPGLVLPGAVTAYEGLTLANEVNLREAGRGRASQDACTARRCEARRAAVAVTISCSGSSTHAV